MTDNEPGGASQPAWMSHAWRELGQHEVAGAKSNPRIRDYYKEAGHPAIVSDEVAWCAAFASACLERAGITSTRSLMARSYLGWGQALLEPRLGCVVVFTRGSDQSLGHAGFWVGEREDAILVLGGNQQDAVSVAALERSRLIGYRWPDETGLRRESSGADGGTILAAGKSGDPLFDTALAHVLEVEGGYTDDPHDPGGPTNKGITLGDYARFKSVDDAGPQRAALITQLKAISDREVRAIYDTFYWRSSRAADLPPALALMHFDAAVNHGVGAAARFLQRAVGADVDGEIGPLTLGAAHAVPIEKVLEAYAEIRRERYRSLGHFWRFGRGWLRRVDIALGRSKALISTAATTIPLQQKGEEMSENELSGGQGGAKWWGHSMTIWGAVITTMSTVLPILAPSLGVDLTPDMVRQLGDQTLNAAQAIGGLIGTVMTIYGRTRAAMPLMRREVRWQL